MSPIDWIVLFLTIFFIVTYGVWKSRNTKNIDGYFLADRKFHWYHIGLSVMATQASAITFLSGPGQAYTSGLGFIQIYFGIPLAMVVLCIVFLPVLHKLNVYTAYEYLEKRFDVKTRSLTAFLFLLQRGLSTGLTIYAPALILSTILDLQLIYTTVFIGGIVICYTVYGGTKAVSHTQMLQMCIIFSGLIFAAAIVVHMLPKEIGFIDALQIAGKMKKLNPIDLHFDIKNKYTIWSGIIGGFFLSLSYFGTDQSQVGRYLSGETITQSRIGLIMNGLIKIPMQFLILLIGTMVFTFYLFHTPPVFFNKTELTRIEQSEYKDEFKKIEAEHQIAAQEKTARVNELALALSSGNKQTIDESQKNLEGAENHFVEVRASAVALMKKNDSEADTNDSNYIFLSFVTTYLPKGMVGLLIAIIFLAAMGATASGLNALASTTIVDFYKRFVKHDSEKVNYIYVSRWATAGWGIFCVLTAIYAGEIGNLIEAVNILGSLFYGTILGIFLVAFFLKHVKGNAVFYSALLTEGFVIICWRADVMAFLWLNVLGCMLVVVFSLCLNPVFGKLNKKKF